MCIGAALSKGKDGRWTQDSVQYTGQYTILRV